MEAQIWSIEGSFSQANQRDGWVRKLLAAVLAQAVQDARMATTHYERQYGRVDSYARGAIIWLFVDSTRLGSAATVAECLGYDLRVLRRRLLHEEVVRWRCRRMRLPLGFPPPQAASRAHSNFRLMYACA